MQLLPRLHLENHFNKKSEMFWKSTLDYSMARWNLTFCQGHMTYWKGYFVMWIAHQTVCSKNCDWECNNTKEGLLSTPSTTCPSSLSSSRAYGDFCSDKNGLHKWIFSTASGIRSCPSWVLCQGKIQTIIGLTSFCLLLMSLAKLGIGLGYVLA